MKFLKKFNESKKEYSQEDIEDYYIDLIDIGYKVSGWEDENGFHPRFYRWPSGEINIAFSKESIKNADIIKSTSLSNFKKIIEKKKSEHIQMDSILDAVYNGSQRIESTIGKVIIERIDLYDDVGLPLEYPSYIQISITPNDKSIERTNLDS